MTANRAGHYSRASSDARASLQLRHRRILIAIGLGRQLMTIEPRLYASDGESMEQDIAIAPGLENFTAMK